MHNERWGRGGEIKLHCAGGRETIRSLTHRGWTGKWVIHSSVFFYIYQTIFAVSLYFPDCLTAIRGFMNKTGGARSVCVHDCVCSSHTNSWRVLTYLTCRNYSCCLSFLNGRLYYVTQIRNDIHRVSPTSETFLILHHTLMCLLHMV